MYFPSKKDMWMSIILWSCSILFIVPPLFFPDLGVWMTPDFLDKQWIKIVVLFPFGFCLLWMWFKTGYTIQDNFLLIQFGPFNWKIRIDLIHSVRKTRNPFTDPALSMDKIEINYGRFQTIGISPKNKFEFISELRKQNSNIKIDSNFEKAKES
ncbi:PH domain-containing protein [Planococcus sp. CAU13]|uniref:PH domain-containing protein n=1 Tax=Planococcus sp. CAU13 TaxID=1541197 RepID=UPI00052FFC70|nr:PH domain-containing protein [Planococcus sp. CAU13]